MKHTVQVGKPIIKNDKVVAYEEVTEISSNQAFNYNRRGFVTLQPGDLKAVKQAPKAAAPAKEPAKEKPEKTPASKKSSRKKKSSKKKKSSNNKTGK